MKLEKNQSSKTTQIVIDLIKSTPKISDIYFNSSTIHDSNKENIVIVSLEGNEPDELTLCNNSIYNTKTYNIVLIGNKNSLESLQLIEEIKTKLDNYNWILKSIDNPVYVGKDNWDNFVYEISCSVTD